jgi:Protein of unknown function (DUF3293)
VLRVGVRSTSLALIHASHAVDCSAFITACNPQGRLSDEPGNARRQLELRQELERRGLTAMEGLGRHPRGEWPPEPSFLVPGLSREEARMLGRRFAQNAVVWAGADAVPELILLR